MKLSVVPSSSLGDAVIMLIASHHLEQAGFDVTTITKYRFGKWFSGKILDEIGSPDAIFLQHGNDQRSRDIKDAKIPVYTFYGSYRPEKHGSWQPGYDFVSDLNQTMVANIQKALRVLFSIDASDQNGFFPPDNLQHRKYPKRVVIHTTSGDPARNWPLVKFEKIASWLIKQGFEPVFLPKFQSIDELISYIYESGFFLGNDSGPGHIASCLQIPNLVIGREERHMRHWRPGWKNSEVILPPRWLPNFKGFRLRETCWKNFIKPKKVIKLLESNVLKN